MIQETKYKVSRKSKCIWKTKENLGRQNWEKNGPLQYNDSKNEILRSEKSKCIWKTKTKKWEEKTEEIIHDYTSELKSKFLLSTKFYITKWNQVE